MSDLTEHPLSHQELLKGRFLHAFRDQVRLPNGQLRGASDKRKDGLTLAV